MEFEHAFRIVMDKWPEEVDISNVKFHSNGGANIPALTKIHETVETQCINLGKEVVAMEWSFFQYFHAQAKALYKKNTFKVNKHSINIYELKELYLENIS